jgi:hypothetical protein
LYPTEFSVDRAYAAKVTVKGGAPVALESKITASVQLAGAT